MAETVLKPRWKIAKAKKKKKKALPPEIQMERELIEAERKLTAVWAEQNRMFKSEKHLKRFDDITEKYKELFTSLVVKYLGIANGAIESNNLIKYGLQMQEAGIDMSQLAPVLTKLMKIDLVSNLVKETGVSNAQRIEIVSRYIAREFPQRDGTADNNLNGRRNSNGRSSEVSASNEQ